MNFSCALHQAERRVIKLSLKALCDNSIGLKCKYKCGIDLKWEHFLSYAHQKPSEEVKMLKDESEWKLLQLVAHCTVQQHFEISSFLFFHQLLSRWKLRVFSIVWGCWTVTIWEAVLTRLPSDSQILIPCAWAVYWSLVLKGDKLFSQEVLVPNKAHGSMCPTFILVRDLGKSLVGFSHDFRMGECKKKKTNTKPVCSHAGYNSVLI